MLETEKVDLSANLTQQIDHWLKKYPKDRRLSAVLPALTLAQDEQGYLTEPVMKAVADYLQVPYIRVFEVATFYDMYDLKPVGRHKIKVCTNVSCLLRGSEKIVEHIEKRLDIKVGETTEDKQFHLRTVECLGACTGAPMMQLDKTYHEHLTPEKIDELLENVVKQDV